MNFPLDGKVNVCERCELKQFIQFNIRWYLIKHRGRLTIISHWVRMTSNNHLCNIWQSPWTCIILAMQLSYKKIWPIKLRKACKLMLLKERCIFLLSFITNFIYHHVYKNMNTYQSLIHNLMYSPNQSESLKYMQDLYRKIVLLLSIRRHFLITHLTSEMLLFWNTWFCCCCCISSLTLTLLLNFFR